MQNQDSIVQRSYLVVPLNAAAAPAEVNDVISLFEAIAGEEGWQPGNELRAHIHRSTYFALSTVYKELIGGLQLVHPDAAGSLPCESVWPEMDYGGRCDIAHVAVLAVKKEWRSRGNTDRKDVGSLPGLFWLLCVAMWQHCVEQDIGELWLEATPRTLACYRRIGFPLVIRGPLRPHWNELCYICCLDVQEVAETIAAKAGHSSAYQHILAVTRATPEPDGVGIITVD